MSTPFRVLIIDDSEKDVLLVERALRKNWSALATERVDTAAAMRQALKEKAWDCVLCDMVIPGFGAPAALEIFGKGELDLPFVVVSGVIGIEDAISLMKAGAHDFVRKDELARLVPTLERAIREVENRRKKKDVESRLSKSEKRFRAAVDAASDAIVSTTDEGIIIYWNRAAGRIFGYASYEIIGKSIIKVIPQHLRLKHENALKRTGEAGGLRKDGAPTEAMARAKDGSEVPIELTFSSWEVDGQRFFTCIIRDVTERKLAEQQLKTAHARLSEAFDSIAGGIDLYDRDDRLVLSSTKKHGLDPGMTDLFMPGASFESIVRKYVEMKHVRSAIERPEEWIQKRLAQHRSQNGSTEFLTRHGRWIQLSDYRTHEGETLVIRVDITERKKVEEALKESEKRLRKFFDEADIGMIEATLEGRFLRANPKFCAMLGYSEKELLSKTIHDVTHPDDRATSLDARTAIWGGRDSPKVFEKRYFRKDGEVVWGAVSRTVIADSEGKPLYIIAQIQNITERKKAEELARFNRAQVVDALGSVSDGVDVYDAEDRLVSSTVGERRFGFDIGDLFVVGETFETILRKTVTLGIVWEAEDRPEEWIKKRLAKHRRAEGFVEIEFTEGKWVRLHEYRARDGGTLVIHTDITQSKQMEAQLRQAQKLETIGTLAGGIAHDLNNILTPIFGSVEFALADMVEGSQIHKDLLIIKKASERAKETVKQILTFSRRVEPYRETIQVQDITGEALKLLRISLPSTIEIRHSLMRDCPPVFADRSQIHQVIMNLGINAQHAMKERNGVLEVGLDLIQVDQKFAQLHPNLKEKSYIRLCVSDTGEGMNEKTQGRIFEPFFTTRDVGKGTGLGLAIVHGIVMAHEGEITVQSEPGKGTTFCIYLPLAVDQEVQDVAEIEVIPGDGEHILLVDDDDDNVEMFTRMLEDSGYQVTATASSTTAMEIFHAHPTDFDLVVTDQTMPHMTGKQIAKEMSAVRPELPIILLSGFMDDLSAEQQKEIGIRAQVMKPVMIDELCSTIQRCLGKTGKIKSI